jgi:hypothetical protein
MIARRWTYRNSGGKTKWLKWPTGSRRQYGRQQCHVARSCQCPRCSKEYDNAHHSGADLKHQERQRNTGTTVLSAASRAAEPSRNCWIHCTGQRHELRHVTAAHQRVRQLRIREQSAPCEILTMCSKSMPMRASHRDTNHKLQAHAQIANGVGARVHSHGSKRIAAKGV